MRKISYLVLLILVSGLTSIAQITKYATPATFKDLNTVYTYQKSNWDGSHASTIFLYIKDTNQIQSFKFSEGDEYATLVSARINWKTYTVDDFKNHRVFKNGERRLLAQLQQKDSMISFKVMDFSDSMKLAHPLWHSYDFDFASLGFTWRALKNPVDSFYFHIADAGMQNEKIAFLNKGLVTVKYSGKDLVNDKELYRYSINGEGLQHKGGSIWINPKTSMIELYKIELPDEEGFVNGMLKLLKTKKMSEAQWEQFIDQKMK